MTFLFLLISFVVGIIASKATVEEKYISASFFILSVFRRQLRPLVIVPAFLVLEGCRDLLGLVACRALIVGPSGPPGTPGTPGIRGLPGTKGDKGDSGLSGQIGKAGKIGPKGVKGSQGILGPAGSKGHRGLKGEKGSPGVVPRNDIESLLKRIQELEERTTFLNNRSQTSLLFSDCDCQCLQRQGRPSGAYYTVLDEFGLIQIYCDMETDGGGWTVFQRRLDGSVSFDRGWNDYEKGFGSVDGDYWLGLALLHRLLLLNKASELRVDLKDYYGRSAYAQYSSFSVGNCTSKYRINVSGYSGTAGNAFVSSLSGNTNNGMKFTTKDQDNDKDRSRNCANTFNGGWWFNACHRAFLNAAYKRGDGWDNIIWYSWKKKESLKFSEIKFRSAK